MVCWFESNYEYGGHDFYFHFYRFEVLMDALKAGNYPIYLDYKTLEGYGYFTKAFYPDLVLIPFVLIGILTNSVFAFNCMIFVLTFLCGLFMYYAVYTVFKSSFIASVSSLLYTFSAYHIFDWYNRGALGEAISFTFLPLIFLGLYHIIIGDYKRWYILTIGYSLLIYTHLLSSFLTFLVIILLLLACCRSFIKEPKRMLFLLLAAVVTLAIVASYLFPMLEQMSSNDFHYSLQGNITGQTKQGLSEIGWGMLSGIYYMKEHNMCGVGPLIIFLVLLRLFIRREKSLYIKIADLCLFVGLFLLFMISSFFPWGRLPLGFIQFPWRLYEFVVFFLSISGAYYLYTILKSKWQLIAGGCVVVLFTFVVIIAANRNYKYWQTLTKIHCAGLVDGNPRVDNDYYLGMYEYLPVKTPSLRYVHERGDLVKASIPTTFISDFSKNKGIISFKVETDKSDKIELPLIYYKGYRAVDEQLKELLIQESDYGLVEVSVDKPAEVKVYYEGTIIQKISWYISLLSVLGLCVYIIYSKRKKIGI